MEGNKVTTYAVVALVVGILVGVGVGYAAFHGSDNNNNNGNADDTYWFYLYFGDNSINTHWYKGTGSDAGVAFEKAMKDANIKYEASESGYISTIDGKGGDNGWYLAQYLYKNTDQAAAKASILYPTESYGTLRVSNGWASIAGYDGVSGLKLSEIESVAFFMSMYNADYSAASPVSTTTWMMDTTGPFAAA